MLLTSSPTELTTAATDALLAVQCSCIILWLWRYQKNNRWKTCLWCSVFGLVFLASLLGSLAHGFILTEPVRSFIWHPLYLSLGLAVALFIPGAAYDACGRELARKILPWALATGIAFYITTVIFNGIFILFVLYEGIVMGTAFFVYIFLARKGTPAGSGIIALAIFGNMIAGGVQATDITVTLAIPFDHNGLFHLVQMGALIILAYGLSASMRLDRKTEIRSSA